ncbi:MAG: CPBP family intramembrane metalloprotease [Clostridia bacterium]|nr:CPBP family intramembrane metalloprotease [Clostridia bacterium]
MKLSPLTRALIWIGAYVISFSAADALSESLGTPMLITCPLALAMTAVLLIRIFRSGQAGFYGLRRLNTIRLHPLHILPFILIASANFWGGVNLHPPTAQDALHIVTMLCVGLIEEVIFRGLLFRAIEKDGYTAAIIICGLTFGIGHIMNLLSGAEFLPTLMQIVYASAAGFCFTLFFSKTGHLIPCIICHSLLNATSIFSVPSSLAVQAVHALLLTVIAGGYALYLYRMKSAENAAQ